MLQRLVWAVVGLTSVGIGLLGVVIPIIPGILFLLFAAVCFSRAMRSSDATTSRAKAQDMSLVDELRADMHQQYRQSVRFLRRFRRR